MHFKVYSRFFYSRLSDSHKKIYDKLLSGWLDYKEEIKLFGSFDDVDFGELLHSIYKDNPELFYLDTTSMSLLMGFRYIVVSVKFKYPRSECEKLKSRIQSVIDRVVSGCKTAADKEQFIHDFLAVNVSYAYGSGGGNYNHDVYSIIGALLNRTAVCEGYSLAFKLLCDAAEIPCILVSGTAVNSAGSVEPHAWNIVRRNKLSYHVDVTWDSCLGPGLCGQLYYNVSDDYISKNHFWEKSKWPICRDNSIIESKTIAVTGKKSLGEALVRMSNEKREEFILSFNKRFSSNSELASIISSLMNNLSVRVPSYSVVYVQSLDCAVIRFNF